MERKMRNPRKGAKRTDDGRCREEHLPGAYIRSLVKQLTASSKSKQEEESSSGIITATSSTKFGGASGDAPQSQQVKKQLRRRTRTSKPYQGRPLNMAEARNEIVTALKYHRAAMMQAQSEANRRESQENHIFISSGTANLTFPNIGAPPHPFPWIPPTLESAGLPTTNLPSETLDLNLNFHHLSTPSMGFFERDRDNTGFNKDPISVFNCSSSSLTTFFAHQDCTGVAPTATVPGVADISPNRLISPLPMSSDSVCQDAGAALHPVLDEKEMAEIRCLGEQHQMEWNDTMNLVSSAWWFNFLNDLEVREEGSHGKVDGSIFDEFMEIPALWKDGVDNVATKASANDEYEDFLQDIPFEWKMEEISKACSDLHVQVGTSGMELHPFSRSR